MCLRTCRSRSNDGAGTVNGISLQQDLTHVIQRALGGIANFEHLVDLAEFRKHVNDVVLHLGVAQGDVVVEMVLNQFTEKSV